jgi:hypothetical protein
MMDSKQKSEIIRLMITATALLAILYAWHKAEVTYQTKRVYRQNDPKQTEESGPQIQN